MEETVGPSTIADLGRMLRRRETTSSLLTAGVLRRASRLDNELGSYLCRYDEQALAAAARADAAFEAGIDRGPLQGIPVAIKDVLAMVEGPTTAQSLAADLDWWSGRDAPAVARLRAAGAVLTGKSTLSEYAIGRPEPGAPFPVPRNPWDHGCWPGGSSSGTAVGIAASFFFAGLGTDTGGSIRIPAAMCGVCGLKPTYGRVSRAGCIPLAFSLDHVGPIARSAWDCAAVLQVVAGYDPADPSSSRQPVGDLLAGLDESIDRLRIGVESANVYATDADASTLEAYVVAVQVLAELGATLQSVSLPLYRETCAATLVTMQAESLSYHLRNLREHWSEYGPTARRRIAAGAFVSGPEYVQAQRVRGQTQRMLCELFAEVDVIATLTVSRGAPRNRSQAGLEVDSLREHIRTSYWNGVGNPALTVPIGFNDDGLPVSIQFSGRPFEEALVLKVGYAFQRMTDWHLREPAVAPAPDVRSIEPGHLEASGFADATSVVTGRVRSILEEAELPAEEDARAMAAAYGRHRMNARLLADTELYDAEPTLRFSLLHGCGQANSQLRIGRVAAPDQ